MFTIFVDMDGVVANIIDHWLDEYNKDWNDNKTSKDMKSFGLEKYVKPECGPFVFDYMYRKKFFRKAKVYENSQKYLLNGDILIDDYEKNLINFSGFRLLFSRPWNEHVSEGSFHEVRNWEEIY